MTRRSGGTPSGSTGPSTGPQGSGYYYFAETSSPRVTGDIFELEYHPHCSQISSVVFRFSMYGITTGTLSVVASDGSDKWTRSGDQGSAWSPPASVIVGTSSFKFKYVRGSSYTGDAAVGDVTVVCSGSVTSIFSPPPPSPTPALPPPPPLAPPGGQCKMFCPNHPKPWSIKCNWGGCAGCVGCGTTFKQRAMHAKFALTLLPNTASF